jgi:hypothetical protein
MSDPPVEHLVDVLVEGLVFTVGGDEIFVRVGVRSAEDGGVVRFAIVSGSDFVPFLEVWVGFDEWLPEPVNSNILDDVDVLKGKKRRVQTSVS